MDRQGTATLARTGSTRVDRLLAAALRNGCTVEPSRVVDGCWIIRSAERDDRTLTVYAYGNNGATGVHEATATREDSPSQAWPVRLSNVQARAARYVEVTP